MDLPEYRIVESKILGTATADKVQQVFTPAAYTCCHLWATSRCTNTDTRLSRCNIAKFPLCVVCLNVLKLMKETTKKACPPYFT